MKVSLFQTGTIRQILLWVCYHSALTEDTIYAEVSVSFCPYTVIVFPFFLFLFILTIYIYSQFVGHFASFTPTKSDEEQIARLESETMDAVERACLEIWYYAEGYLFNGEYSFVH